MDLKKAVLAGVGWNTALFAIGRLMSFGAGLVTTRLLLPADFGLLAVVLAVTTFLDRITTFGLESALVQRKEIVDADLDVAFTYQALRNLGLWLAIFLGAPWLGKLASEQDVGDLLRLASFGVLLAGLRNVGVVRLRRELRFREIAILEAISPAAYALLSVGFALAHPNVWALAWASVAASAISTAGSYGFRCHRPRWNACWTRAKSMFGFGIFLLGNTLLLLLREQGVVFYLSNSVPLEDVGFFNRATALTLGLFLPLTVIFWRFAYPVASRLQSQPAELRRFGRKGTLVVGGLGLMGASAVAGTAPWLVPMVLGARWAPMIPMVQLLAAQGLAQLLAAPSETVLHGIGRPGVGLCCNLVVTVVLAALLPVAVDRYGVTGATLASATAQLLGVPCMMIAAGRALRATKHTTR